MAAEKENGKDIKTGLLSAIKEKVNETEFPYLHFPVQDNELVFDGFSQILKFDIPCVYPSYISRKVCTLITGCAIMRFIPTGDNYRGIPTGFNVYGTVLSATVTSGNTIHIIFKWKGVYHE